MHARTVKVRVRLATSVAVELCALMLEIINGILSEGRFKATAGGGAGTGGA